MEAKLIGCQEYTVDLYDIKLIPKDDRKFDLYVRHNTRMSIYEAKNYELTKINVKTVETALKGNRKDLAVSFKEAKCEQQEILEVSITIEMPLLPKTTEIIYVPLLKTLKDTEVLHSKLSDVKKKILTTNATLDEFQKLNKGKYVVTKKEISHSSSVKQDLASLTVPMGTYLFTISGFITTNASNYMAVGLSKGDICPGTYTSCPAEAQNTPMAYHVRIVVNVTNESETINFWGQVGSSYPYRISNFIMTAERLSDHN